jgi:hypothetical protein
MEKMEDNEDFYSVLTTVNKTVGLTYQRNLEVFYYLRASKIWPDKRGGSGLIREGLLL